MIAGYYNADFSAMQLLKVMSRLTQPDVASLPYFLLCRELGVRAVDGMVRGRVLDLRWTETVTKESGEMRNNGIRIGEGTNMETGLHGRTGSSRATTMGTEEGGGMVAISERDLEQMQANMYEEDEQEDIEVVGPKLVAMTPIMRFAMCEVVEEYEDQRSLSEYASLSDVDEY